MPLYSCLAGDKEKKWFMIKLVKRIPFCMSDHFPCTNCIQKWKKQQVFFPIRILKCLSLKDIFGYYLFWCPKRGQLSSGLVQPSSEYLLDKDSTDFPDNLFICLIILRVILFFLYLLEIFFPATCVYCLMAYNYEPPAKVPLHLLYTIPSCSWGLCKMEALQNCKVLLFI